VRFSRAPLNCKDELQFLDENAVTDFFNNNKITICINCAAYTAVDKAETEREIAIAVKCNSRYIPVKKHAK
jgi:dTDP-4-dehydrorhamnose reductase